MIAALPWPTWQQAWTATAVCVVAAIVLTRIRPSRATQIAIPAVRELAVLTALYGLWRTARRLPLVQSDGAVERARTIVDVQDAMLLPSERVVNDLAVRHDWLGWVSSAYYAGLHVPALFAFLVWMFWRHRDHYGHWRDVLALTTAGCLAIRFWRVAPPRFLPELGFVDVTVVHGMDVYGPVGTGVSGQFVAMPSIHVAWAGVVAFGVLSASPSRWRRLVALHLPITVFVVSATGHHWWLDGIVALGLVGLAALADDAVRRVVARRRTAPGGVGAGRSEFVGDGGEEVVVGGHRPELRELGDDVVG